METMETNGKENPVRVFASGAVGVNLGLFLRRLYRSLQPKSPWEKLDINPPDVVAPAPVRQPEVAETPIQHQADEPEKGLWVDCSYCWVVVCKNRWFHRKRNIFNVHRIPLAQTDAVADRPAIDRRFLVRCGECGKAYMFKPSEVLRWEMDVPPSFIPHPLFLDE